jgi:hypothetical protein
MVHLNYKGNLIRHVRIENIHLKFSLDSYFDVETKGIVVKNPFLHWTVYREGSEMILELSEKLHLIGLNMIQERSVEKDYLVRVSVNGINFNSNPTPTGLLTNGNYGLAFISVVGKANGRRPVRRTVAPPRYLQIREPSAPLADSKL